MLSPVIGFPLFLFVTVALLGGVVWTGLRARRRLHLRLVAAAVVSLGFAIFFAERLGRLYDLESAGAIYPVHITIAKIATGSYLLPILTGMRTLKNPKHRKLHFWCAMAVLALTVLTAVTGTWMIFASEPLPTTE